MNAESYLSIAGVPQQKRLNSNPALPGFQRQNFFDYRRLRS
jgi:hypothetical protein